MTAAAIAVRERPILFSGPMVRALLDGTKTQTRRVALHKRRAFASVAFDLPWIWAKLIGAPDPHEQYSVRCPYGQPGDRLWVRETWGVIDDKYHRVAFRADEGTASGRHIAQLEGKRWRPSIHMHRFTSRITLEITGVGIERVQKISDADATAEGVAQYAKASLGLADEWTPREQYEFLWDSLNGARGYGWDANPYVWVIEFRRVTS